MTTAKKKWSAEVTEHSDAMDLKSGVFKLRSPKRIAESVKQSAERSHRRKASPFQSAMSMLNFYVNRAGRNLSTAQKKKLIAAKDELRRLYGRSTVGGRPSVRATHRTNGGGGRAAPRRRFAPVILRRRP